MTPLPLPQKAYCTDFNSPNLNVIGNNEKK